MSPLRAWTGTRRYRPRCPGPSPFLFFMGGTSVRFRDVLPAPRHLPLHRCALRASHPPSSSSSGHLLAPAPPTFVHTASPVLRSTNIPAASNERHVHLRSCAFPSEPESLAAARPQPPPPLACSPNPRSTACIINRPPSTCHHLGHHSDAPTPVKNSCDPTTTTNPTPDSRTPISSNLILGQPTWTLGGTYHVPTTVLPTRRVFTFFLHHLFQSAILPACTWFLCAPDQRSTRISCT